MNEYENDDQFMSKSEANKKVRTTVNSMQKKVVHFGIVIIIVQLLCMIF